MVCVEITDDAEDDLEQLDKQVAGNTTG